jgi:hypothetical protein
MAHLTTSSHHPQCNSQAEVANKTIAKYLSSFGDDSTLDWELYLAPLMFAYNMSFHRTIKTSPFFLTYGMELRFPALPIPDLQQKFYGKSSTDDLIRKLLLTRDIARRNSEVASDKAERQFNKKAEPHSFLPDQIVLLDEHSFLAKNQKLAPKWSGPHKILRLKGECNVELLLQHNNKKLITHMNRLKPYFVPKSAAVTSPDFFLAEKSATPPPVAVQEDATEIFFPYNDFYPLDSQVTSTNPIPSRSIQLLQQASRRRHTSLSSSFLYDDSPMVSASDPSPALSPTYAQIATCPLQRFSSLSSTSSHHSLPKDNIAAPTRSRSHSLTPEQPKIYMPQISFDPLPVLKEGEGLEENEDIAIRIVDGHNSWTVVQRKKKKKKKKYSLSEKWTKQQRENFVHFGDIWYQEPYKNYHVSEHATPVANAPQPQQQLQQQPVFQPPPVAQLQPPVLLPQQPIAVPPQLPAIQQNQPALLQPQQGGQLPVPLIVVTPLLQQCAPKIQKCCLQAIPEEDESTGS